MRFLHINSEVLVIDDVFEFPVFIYDPAREQRVLALHPASPVTQELLEQWQQIENRNGHLQIATEDEDLFLEQSQCSKEQLDQFNEFQIKMYEMWQDRLNKYSDVVTNTFSFKDELHKAIQNDDFMPIVERAKAELLLFPITISREVSMMTQLIERILVQDSLITRTISFTYFFALKFGIKEQETVASIIIGSLCKDLGQVLINLRNLRQKDELLNNEIYLKHPMLSIYLISKIPFDFSITVKRIILEQHEEIDGSGFPRGKTESSISILSQIVHMSDYLFKSSMGQLDDKKKDLMLVIQKVSSTESLDNSIPKFSNTLKDVLRSLL